MRCDDGLKNFDWADPEGKSHLFRSIGWRQIIRTGNGEASRVMKASGPD